MNHETVMPLAHELAQRLLALEQRLACAESCTGGLLAASLAEIDGSSRWFEQGWVTYSNGSKQRCLEVEASTLQQFGAVSSQCAVQMAQGARRLAQADYAVAITGIAGPTGGSADKPVGTVFIAWASHQPTQVQRFLFAGERQAVRWQSVDAALRGLLRLATSD